MSKQEAAKNKDDKSTKIKTAIIIRKTIAGGADSFRKRFHSLIEDLEDKGYDVGSPPLIRAYLAISTGKVKFREVSPQLD